MQHKALFGAATRYIAGRNVLQTVYWRSSPDAKFLKVSKTFNMGKQSRTGIPAHIKQEIRTAF